MNKKSEIIITELRCALDWVRQRLKESELPLKVENQLELVLEEAIVNVLTHAFDNQKGQLQLIYRFFPQNKVEFELRDQGKPFNPLEFQPIISDDYPLEERKEGGLGILLIRHYVDSMHYVHEKGFNILLLTKKLS